MADNTDLQSFTLFERWQEELDPDAYSCLMLSAHMSRITILHRRKIGDYAAELGLSQVDSIIMMLLRGLNKSPIYQSDIWKLYEYTPGAVTHRIARLLSLGLVQTRKGEIDLRSVQVELTDTGKAAIDSIVSRASADYAKQWRSLQLTAKQAAQFDEVLSRLERATEISNFDEVRARTRKSSS